MIKNLIQFCAVFTTSLGDFLEGSAIAWTSNAVTVLMSDASPVGRITKDQAGMVGSMPMLGYITATIIGCWLSDKIGRKRTIILAGFCYTISWLIVTMASNLTILLVGRFVTGIACGMHSVTFLPFVSEISDDSIRGSLLCMGRCMLFCGVIGAYLFGWFLSYQVINYTFVTFCTVYTVLIILGLKETPAFLVEKGMDKEALKSLQYYRRMPMEELLTELSYLKEQKACKIILNAAEVEQCLESENENLKTENYNEADDISAWKVLWKSKAYMRAFVVVAANITLAMFGGPNGIVAYAAPFFTKASPTLSPHMCSVIMAVSFMMGSVIAMVITDMIGRRTLMITSGVLSSVLLAMLASLLRWPWGSPWLVPAIVLAYCCFHQMGEGSVPFVQMSEIFPSKLKSLTTMMLLSANAGADFFLLQLFPSAVDTLGLSGAFTVSATICAFTAVQAFFFMKETRGVPQIEIKRMYEEGYLWRGRCL